MRNISRFITLSILIIVLASHTLDRRYFATANTVESFSSSALIDSANDAPDKQEREEARLFVPYRVQNWNAEVAELDDYAIELRREPNSEGYIIGYGARCSKKNQGEYLAERAKSYLVKSLNIHEQRLTAINGGSRGVDAVELWIVPIGAKLPKATPRVNPNAPPCPSKKQSHKS
ncbi:MAG TPA: hypothetical protein VJS44_21660 [Pyrinomonadaceae bacterium]|nr:hypothetical protein [Pyrinomonadaceae bacterium]